MSVIYVREQNSAVYKRGGRIVVQKDEETLAEIPLRETDLVAVFGNVQVSTQALSEFLDRGIPVGLYTRHGRLKGRIVPKASGRLKAKLAQYRAAFDPESALAVAKPLVCAKLANSAVVVGEYRKNYPSDTLAAAVEALKRAEESALSATGVEELMGHEGAGAAAYFRAFAEMNRSGLPFPGRQKHPAPDPVNALLSLGYTMVMNELGGLAEGLGLEPCFGFLHVPEENRPSLALDLMEPFRASLVDRLTLKLVNERVLTGEDFARRVGGPGAGGVVLQPGEAWEKYLNAYEEAMQTPRARAPRGMRDEMEGEVRRLHAALRDGAQFIPYRENLECDT